MQIRQKFDNAIQQGFEDYKNGHNTCPFEYGTIEFDEWEMGWMESRRKGTRGEMKVGGEVLDYKYPLAA